MYNIQRPVFSLAVLIGLLSPAIARADRVSRADFLSATGGLVTTWAPRSARAAATIREEYRPLIVPLALDRFRDIEDGLATGGLVPLPPDMERFNVRIRRDGASPIAEMDLAHQESYVSARTATIGCLFDVAAQVKSGPIEITSLVRHLEYQNALRAANPNATTDVPTHALGLAFDIAMVNTPLETIQELEAVLRRMSDAGDILVIAEREQLVFHVVPQPARLGWYADVYARAMRGDTWNPQPAMRALRPTITTAIGALRPLPAWADEWWAADNVSIDLPVAIHADVERTASVNDSYVPRRGGFSLVTALLSNTWRWLSPLNVG